MLLLISFLIRRDVIISKETGYKIIKGRDDARLPKRDFGLKNTLDFKGTEK